MTSWGQTPACQALVGRPPLAEMFCRQLENVSLLSEIPYKSGWARVMSPGGDATTNCEATHRAPNHRRSCSRSPTVPEAIVGLRTLLEKGDCRKSFKRKVDSKWAVAMLRLLRVIS